MEETSPEVGCSLQDVNQPECCVPNLVAMQGHHPDPEPRASFAWSCLYLLQRTDLSAGRTLLIFAVFMLLQQRILGVRPCVRPYCFSEGWRSHFKLNAATDAAS